MPRLVVQHPDGKSEEHELTRELSIGRGETNDLILTEGGVSRRHARVSVDGDEVLVEDAASSNGTFVDGEKIDGPTVLRPGAQLVIGAYTLSVAANGRAGSALAVRRPAAALAKRPAPKAKPVAAAAPEVMLRGLTGPWANQLFPVTDRLVIGRGGAVEILIEDESVSRRHAEVTKSGDGYVVRDLGSANGTLLNGEPLTGEKVALQPGDVLQVGVVELVLEQEEAPEPQAPEGGLERLNAPIRRRSRGGSRSAVSSVGAAPKSRVGLVVGLALGAVVVVGAIALLMAPEDASPRAAGSGAPLPPVDPRQALKLEVEELLAQCRTFAAADPMNPSWDKAEAACQRAVERNPIDPVAVNLLARIRRDKDAHASYVEADRLISRNANDEALEKLQQIPTDSLYYLRAKPRALEAAKGVKKRAAADCKRYAGRAFWKEAEASCEAYMRIACQDMTRDDLQPPPGEKVKLKGKLGKNEWRPADPMLRNLLEARTQRDPNVALWDCPEMEILKGNRTSSDAKEALEKIFRERLKDNGLVIALMDYWRGKGNDSVTRLQKLVDNPDKTTLHGTARELLKQISQVHQLFGIGQTYLKGETPEKAVDPFTEALALDAQLMKTQVEVYPSWYARGIRQDMASAAYQRGKLLADQRQDFTGACRIWKAGFSFSTGDMALLKAMDFCSTRAREAFARATTCDGLQRVLEFAVPRFSESVPGDGFTEAVKEKKAKLNCP